MFSFLASMLPTTDNPRSRGRLLAAEPLESRQMLSAAGLVEVGAQPDGGLDDKIVYLHGGHGITTNASGWGYQRPLLLDMVEDLGNVDQMTVFAEELWNAGATVVPLRPIGNQVNEVVLDNDDAGVTFDGAWGDGSGSVYYGSAGDIRYGFATTSTVETAVATYRPNLSEAGFYPVYAWSPAGSNRATDQLYRVRHSGGATEVTIDHSRVGNGLVYLGTYHFEAGTEGAVEISNKSDDAGKVVVADMIRFGNGIGDIDRGNGVSGETRENEAAIYWLEWHATRSQGVPSSAYGTSTVSAPTRYATYMNQGAVGTLSDRVFVSFHSNASTGNPSTATARGVVGLHNTNSGGATPNQLLLAERLGRQVNDDLVAQNGDFENNWSSRSTVTFQASFNYGEINNSVINNEFDATIVETGFHDNTLDAELLRDLGARQAIARATYQGLVDYFAIVDSGATANVDTPPEVASLSAESLTPEQVTLDWEPGISSSYSGSAATGYVIYASTNGYGFDGGTFVPGGATTTHTLTGLTAGETYYFRVAAVNAAGESLDSEVAAVKPSASPERLLIVNGFDRSDRSLTQQELFRGSSNDVDRVRVREGNTRDFAVEIAEAINAAGATVAIGTASNEAVANGSVDLTDYDAVVWIAGTESSADETFNLAEQNAVSAFLADGGNLFVSGSEIAWDLDNLNNGRAFYNNGLRADYVTDDAGTYSASGVAGSIFDGLDLQFDNGEETYDVEFPDVIAPTGGSTAALSYGGGAGTAAIQYADPGSDQRVVTAGFPFESIVGETARTAVMSRVLDFFGIATRPTQTTSQILDNDDDTPTYTETGGWSDDLSPGADGGTQRRTLWGAASTATWTTELPTTGDAEVFVRYNAAVNLASGTRYVVTVGDQTRVATVNQQQSDLVWVSLGTFEDASGEVTITVDAAGSTSNGFGFVAADQARVDLTTGRTPNGDFNRDGVVNAADYTVYRDTLGQIVTPLEGADADGSGLIDAADRAAWIATYGQVIPVAAASLVYEAGAGDVERVSEPSSTTSPTTARLPLLVVGRPGTESTPNAFAATRVAFRPTARANAVDTALLMASPTPPASEPTAVDAALARADAEKSDDSGPREDGLAEGFRGLGPESL